MQRVYLATMDNHAFSRDSFLFRIKNALHPKEVIATPYPMQISLNYRKTEELQKVMKKVLGENIFNNG
jgi:hypothetical protein